MPRSLSSAALVTAEVAIVLGTGGLHDSTLFHLIAVRYDPILLLFGSFGWMTFSILLQWVAF